LVEDDVWCAGETEEDERPSRELPDSEALVGGEEASGEDFWGELPLALEEVEENWDEVVLGLEE